MDTNDDGFRSFEDAPSSIPLCIRLDTSGNKLALALSDHKLRVWTKKGEWEILDEWRAHDAEILDIKWLDCIHGQFLVSIGLDYKLKLWKQAPSHTRGRRYRCIFSHSPQEHVPYDAFDLFASGEDIFIGLVSHTGLFSLLEPTNPNSLSSWKEATSSYPLGQQHRSGLPTFDVAFRRGHPIPAKETLEETDVVRFLVAISYDYAVVIHQAIENDDAKIIHQEVMAFEIEDALTEKIAWANIPASKQDLMSLLCDDHMIHLVHLPTSKFHQRSASSSFDERQRIRAETLVEKGADISNRMHNLRIGDDSRGKLEAAEVQILRHEDGSDIVRMQWSLDGSVLMTSSANGKVHFWKESLDGPWVEYAESD